MDEKKAKYEKAAERAEEWAGAGNKALALAQDAAYAEMHGEEIPATPQNVATTIQGAIRLFLNGEIKDTRIRAVMENAGLNMNSLRTDIVEQVMARALPRMIENGEIERLLAIAKAIGEDASPADTARVLLKVATDAQARVIDAHIDNIIGGDGGGKQ